MSQLSDAACAALHGMLTFAASGELQPAAGHPDDPSSPRVGAGASGRW